MRSYMLVNVIICTVFMLIKTMANVTNTNNYDEKYTKINGDEVVNDVCKRYILVTNKELDNNECRQIKDKYAKDCGNIAEEYTNSNLKDDYLKYCKIRLSSVDHDKLKKSLRSRFVIIEDEPFQIYKPDSILKNDYYDNEIVHTYSNRTSDNYEKPADENREIKNERTIRSDGATISTNKLRYLTKTNIYIIGDELIDKDNDFTESDDYPSNIDNKNTEYLKKELSGNNNISLIPMRIINDDNQTRISWIINAVNSAINMFKGSYNQAIDIVIFTCAFDSEKTKKLDTIFDALKKHGMPVITYGTNRKSENQKCEALLSNHENSIVLSIDGIDDPCADIKYTSSRFDELKFIKFNKLKQYPKYIYPPHNAATTVFLLRSLSLYDAINFKKKVSDEKNSKQHLINLLMS